MASINRSSLASVIVHLDDPPAASHPVTSAAPAEILKRLT